MLCTGKQQLFRLGDVKDPNVRRKDPNLLLFGMFDGYYIAPADEVCFHRVYARLPAPAEVCERSVEVYCGPS